MNKRCAESGITLTDLVKLEVFDQVCLDDDDAFDDDNSDFFCKVRYVAGGNGRKR